MDVYVVVGLMAMHIADSAMILNGKMFPLLSLLSRSPRRADGSDVLYADSVNLRVTTTVTTRRSSAEGRDSYVVSMCLAAIWLPDLGGDERCKPAYVGAAASTADSWLPTNISPAHRLSRLASTSLGGFGPEGGSIVRAVAKGCQIPRHLTGSVVHLR